MSDSDNPYVVGPTPRDEERLRRLYWEEDRTVAEVADKLNRTPETIIGWMKEFDIERRDRPRDSVLNRD
jgi:transposase-like protein